MWRVGLLLFLVTGSRQLSITEFSVPSSISSGEDVHLKCKYGLDDNESDRALFVKWWWTPVNASSDDRSQLYQRIVGHAPDVLHSNIHVEEGDNIKLVNASPKDSGTYECEVSNIDEIRKHDDLTVFTGGDGPELNITKVEDGDDEDTDEDISITCSANNVAPEPELVITVNGEAIEITTKQIVWTPDEGLYDAFANATISEKDVDGADVSCELVFLDANITHPQYIYTETYYSDKHALSTTEIPDDPTTPEATSMSLENGSGAGDVLTSHFLLIFSAFSITMIVIK